MYSCTLRLLYKWGVMGPAPSAPSSYNLKFWNLSLIFLAKSES